MVRFANVGYAVVVLTVMSSCSGGAGDHGGAVSRPTSEWTAPAWMAEAKDADETLGSKIASCMANEGWIEERTLSGSYRATLPSPDDGPRYRADRRTCESVVRDVMEISPKTHDDAFFQTMYARALDTRDCLVAHGVVVSEAPSQDAWIEDLKSGSTDVWAPFNDVTGSKNEFYELFDICPQAGIEVTR